MLNNDVYKHFCSMVNFIQNNQFLVFKYYCNKIKFYTSRHSMRYMRRKHVNYCFRYTPKYCYLKRLKNMTS